MFELGLRLELRALNCVGYNASSPCYAQLAGGRFFGRSFWTAILVSDKF